MEHQTSRGYPDPYNVRVHPFTSSTPCSCAYEHGTELSKNALVFMGGLTSGPHAIEYVRYLGDEVLDTMREKDETSYSLFEFRMRSSYTGFGYSSLKNDIEDLAALVKYLKGEGVGKKKVVLIGSSTGCQAIMTYAATIPSPPSVDGYILQGPTSDRETASLLMPEDFACNSLKHAEDLVAKGEENSVMPAAFIPPIFSSPITAYRWHSLISVGGDDDFFSSDISASSLQSTFGKLDKPTLILMSENDEMVPPTVDKDALLKRWLGAIQEGLASDGCSIIPSADHALTSDQARRYFIAKVQQFLKKLEVGVEKH